MSQRLNLLNPRVREDPYPYFAELRRNTPVCQVEPGGLWAVSRYDDALYVLKNPQLFSSGGFRVITEPPWLGRSNPFNESLLLMDPPRHGRLRLLISRAFGASTLARLEPQLRAIADGLVTTLLEQRTVDFLQSFALPIPASAITVLIGLEPSQGVQLKRWVDDLFGISASRPEDIELLEKGRHAIAEMEHHFGVLLERRRRKPCQDLASELLRAQVDGVRLTDAELMGFLFLLLVAGIETTVHLLTHSARVLMTYPEVMDRVRKDHALLPRFIEEVLRYEPPAQGMMRLCTQEVTLGGVTLPKGAPVLILQGSILRDEALFTNPDCFDMDREGAGNFAFGHGIHFCLGAPLARLEARVALESLLARIRRIVPRGEHLEWLPALTVRGVKALPVEVVPA
jgi:cytochrome P450